MPRVDFEKYRQLLEAKREELLRRVRVAGASAESDGEEPDFADRALKGASQETLLALSDEERQVLKLVEEALGRIERGEYGACAACGKPIRAPRLQAVPWARHCIACQELQDRGLL